MPMVVLVELLLRRRAGAVPGIRVAVTGRERRVSLLHRRTPLVAQPAVWCDERVGAELEAAAAGAERTGVHGVVPDRVEELCHGCLRGRVVPDDRQGATVDRTGRARQRGEVPG